MIINSLHYTLFDFVWIIALLLNIKNYILNLSLSSLFYSYPHPLLNERTTTQITLVFAIKESKYRRGGTNSVVIYRKIFNASLIQYGWWKGKASRESGIVKKRQAISCGEGGDNKETWCWWDVNVAQTYNMNPSTISSIYNQKDRIMEHFKSAVGMQSTIISKKKGTFLGICL